MADLPAIDLEKWRLGDAKQRQEVATVFDEAVKRMGFVQLRNHGIPPLFMEAVLKEMSQFFSLPGTEKAICSSVDCVNRGFAAVKSESIAIPLPGMDVDKFSPPLDLVESFVAGPEDVDYSDPFYLAQKHMHFAPNMWPERPANFRTLIVEYFEKATGILHLIIDIVTHSLGLPTGYLKTLSDGSTTTLRLNNYPSREPSEAESDPHDQMRMGAHTDYGMMTLLYADAVPGLEVFSESGEWLSIVPAPDVFLLNLGDLMAQLTNDRWKSSFHRVVPGLQARRSIAFFFDGRYDAFVECLPTCQDKNNPAKYPPVSVGEQLEAKITRQRKDKKVRIISTLEGRFP